MRERLAKALAALLTVLVVLMAAFFARQRNALEPAAPIASAEAVPPPPIDAAMVERGRTVYEAQACARCHSIGGEGNPRNPLDGVGSRLPPGRLLESLTATGAEQARFTSSVVRAKEGFGRLPTGELAALVVYLSSLR